MVEKEKMSLGVFEHTEEHMKRLEELFTQHSYDSDLVNFTSNAGFTVLKDGIIVGAAFLFTTNSPVSYIDMFVVDKNLSREDRNLAIETLLAAIVALSLEWGYKVILAVPRFTKSEKRLLDLGFTEFKSGSYMMRF